MYDCDASGIPPEASEGGTIASLTVILRGAGRRSLFAGIWRSGVCCRQGIGSGVNSCEAGIVRDRNLYLGGCIGAVRVRPFSVGLVEGVRFLGEVVLGEASTGLN